MIQNLFFRHLIVAVVAFLLTLPFWFGRLDWDREMRLWRAVGDSSFLLLFFTLAIGPLARIWNASRWLVPWRRESGIWYGLFALVHTLLIFSGWARWDWMRFLGYEFIPQLGRIARMEPGFGLSNLVGLVAMVLTVILVATSSNWAIDRLGSTAWKWLQYASYSVFYLVVLHTVYFLFMHYTESFHRVPPADPNWFRYPFLGLAATIPVLQMVAFTKTVRRRSSRDLSPVPLGK